LINVRNQLPEPKHQGTRSADLGKYSIVQGDVSNNVKTTLVQIPIAMDTSNDVHMTRNERRKFCVKRRCERSIFFPLECKILESMCACAHI
jgi:hypothetical protein